jgi:hypothetical protein
MNASGIAALYRIVMSNNATHDSYCTSPKTNKNCSVSPSLSALSLQRLPSEELTVDTATAAAAVAATTEVSTLVGGARGCGA